ncbi:MAG: 50S ribosomal protein L1 [Candidatus Nanohaloarchaeota archaeon QJJ-9]|nr:50S ribosomal protein L1 [Candidatus Nanohaloarchaeota archaeon QJJ-9]
MEAIDAIKKAKEESKDRNFTQSLDLIINIEDLELDNPENRFSENIVMPYPASEETKICVIGDTLTQNAENADKEITEDRLEEYFEDQDKAKDLAEEYDFFIAESPLMPDIGKQLGPVLGPRDKMPKPMTPGSDPTDKIEELRKTVSINLKEHPSVKCKIGNEAMKDEDVAENANAIINRVRENLPRGDHNVKATYIKLTMGPAIKVN